VISSTAKIRKKPEREEAGVSLGNSSAIGVGDQKKKWEVEQGLGLRRTSGGNLGLVEGEST